MRKIFILFSVILIIVLSAVPAFAVDTSSSIYYPVLQFDTIYSSVIPDMKFSWPFNNFTLGASNSEFSLGDGFFYGDITTSDSNAGNSVSASFTTPIVAGNVGENVTLYLSHKHTQIVPRGYLGSENSYEIVGSSDITISSVRVSSWVGIISDKVIAGSSDTEYDVEYLSFDKTFACDDNVARIGVWVNECLNAISEINGQYWVLLENFVVELTVSRNSNVTPTLYVFSDLSPNVHSIGSWLYNYELKKSETTIVNGSTDFDVTSWLTKAAGSFLDFEIAPGFSFNKLFYLILVIGVLLAFFKMIS